MFHPSVMSEHTINGSPCRTYRVDIRLKSTIQTIESHRRRGKCPSERFGRDRRQGSNSPALSAARKTHRGVWESGTGIYTIGYSVWRCILAVIAGIRIGQSEVVVIGLGDRATTPIAFIAGQAEYVSCRSVNRGSCCLCRFVIGRNEIYSFRVHTSARILWGRHRRPEWRRAESTATHVRRARTQEASGVAIPAKVSLASSLENMFVRVPEDVCTSSSVWPVPRVRKRIVP